MYLLLSLLICKSIFSPRKFYLKRTPVFSLTIHEPKVSEASIFREDQEGSAISLLTLFRRCVTFARGQSRMTSLTGSSRFVFQALSP